MCSTIDISGSTLAVDHTVGYHQQYWFNDLPRDWDWLRQMGLVGKWIYSNELHELLSRVQPTKSKNGWEMFLRNFNEVPGWQYGATSWSIPKILRSKPGLVRRAKEQDPSLPLKFGLAKFAQFPNPDGQDEGVQEVLTSLKFTLGAHGLDVEKYPLERFPRQYAAVVVSDELAARRYVGAHNLEQWRLRPPRRLPTMSLILDKTPEEPVLSREEYLEILSKDPPNVE